MAIFFHVGDQRKLPLTLTKALDELVEVIDPQSCYFSKIMS